MAGIFLTMRQVSHYEFGMDFVAWLTEFEIQLMEEGELAELHMIVPFWLGSRAFSVYDRVIPERAKKDYLLLRRELLLRCSTLSAAQQKAESARFEREYLFSKMQAAAETEQLAARAGQALPATAEATVLIEAATVAAAEAAQLEARAGHALQATTEATVSIEAATVAAAEAAQLAARAGQALPATTEATVSIEAATVKEVTIILEVATVTDAATVAAATVTTADATVMSISTVTVTATATAAVSVTAPAATTSWAITAAEKASSQVPLEELSPHASRTRVRLSLQLPAGGFKPEELDAQKSGQSALVSEAGTEKDVELWSSCLLRKQIALPSQADAAEHVSEARAEKDGDLWSSCLLRKQIALPSQADAAEHVSEARAENDGELWSSCLLRKHIALPSEADAAEHASEARAEKDGQLWSSCMLRKQIALPSQADAAEQLKVYVESRRKAVLGEPAVKAVRRISSVLRRRRKLASEQSHDIRKSRVLRRLRMPSVT